MTVENLLYLKIESREAEHFKHPRPEADRKICCLEDKILLTIDELVKQKMKS